MKKFTLGLILLGALSMGASSCKNSVECCDDNGYCYTISRSDHPVPGTFKLAIADAESEGYECD